MRKVIILSASFLLVFNACKKDGMLTPDFEENTTFSFFSDSTKIESLTRIGDSVLADQVSIGLLGLYKDSAFGKTTSSIYVQPVLSSNGLIFGEPSETLEIDSIVLSMEYSDYFGDTSAMQTFDVYRLTEKLDIETNYYSDTSIQTETNAIGSRSITPTPFTETVIYQPNNTGGVDTVGLVSQLRIRLDNSLGTEILSKSGGTELSDNDNFTEFFKGLKIVPRDNGTILDNENAILYFRLTASNTKMTVYYRSITTTMDTTRESVDFPINTSSVRFNSFEHDYSNSAVESILQNPTGSIYAFTEAMASVETVIKFPTIKSDFKNKVLVNKAELVLPVAYGSYSNFGVANSLIVAGRNDDGSLQFIPDAFENASYFGGEYDDSDSTYKFNITRYVQGLLNGTQNDNGLTVLVTGSAVKAERAIFLTENNSGSKFQLNLYYTNTQ